MDPIVDANGTTMLNPEYNNYPTVKINKKKLTDMIGYIDHHFKARHANLDALPDDAQFNADRGKFGMNLVLLYMLPFSIEDEQFDRLCAGIGKRKALVTVVHQSSFK